MEDFEYQREKWEYRIVPTSLLPRPSRLVDAEFASTREITRQQTEKDLNGLGLEGWELVVLQHAYDDDWVAVLKRRI